MRLSLSSKCTRKNCEVHVYTDICFFLSRFWCAGCLTQREAC